MEPNNKGAAQVLVDMSGKQQKDILLIDVDEKNKNVMILSEDSAEGSVPEESAKGAAKSPPKGTEANKEDEGGVAAVTPPMKNNTNNLVAKIELLETQSASRSVVWSLSTLPDVLCC